MEADSDDLFVVIVGDGNSKSVKKPLPAKTLKVDKIINTVVKLGEFIEVNVKEEPNDDLETEGDEHDNDDDKKLLQELNDIKSEPEDVDSDYCYDPLADSDNVDDDDYILEKETTSKKDTRKRRRKKGEPKKTTYYKMLKPEEYKSFVAELRQKYPELNENEDLLIETIVGLMREVTVPDPPKDFYLEDGSKKVCTYCDTTTPSLVSAVRHYQEKHGPRYLVCYACGYDFTCTGNLYRHETRCRSPDAHIVLKARRRWRKNKGKPSPFVQFYTPRVKPEKSAMSFPCSECSAVFPTRSTLSAHENLHKGLRPYRCTQCTYAFVSAEGLYRHRRSHSDIEFICDYCNKSFKFKSTLVSHIYTHNKLKKHACEYCDRRFRQSGALRHHVNTVHLKLPPPCACQVCDKRYPRMSLLKVHMNKVHGLQLMTRMMFVNALPKMSEVEVQKVAKIVMKSDLKKNI